MPIAAAADQSFSGESPGRAVPANIGSDAQQETAADTLEAAERHECAHAVGESATDRRQREQAEPGDQRTS